MTDISMPESFPEGAPAPDQEQPVPVDGPEMPPEAMPTDPMMMAPEQPVADPFGEGSEVEWREKLSINLMRAANAMAEAATMMREGNDAENAEKYAVAAQRLTQAHVLLEPLEASDDLATGQVGASAARVQAADSASKGMRRSAQ